MQHRLEARFRAYDRLGTLRAATADDMPAARWLAAEAGESQLMRVAIERLVVHRAELAWDGGRIEGLPLFDGGLTGPAGVEGRLGAEILFTEMHPGAAALKQMPFERQRRESAAKAMIVALRTEPDGLAPLNAPNFRAPFGPPVLQVAGREAARIAALAGAAMRVTLDATRSPGESANVLAELPGGAAPPLVVMTPRTSWWNSLGERAGGVLAWLEALEVLRGQSLARPAHFAATCGHELGHIGLNAWLESAPGLVQRAALFLHLGANLGAAGGGVLTIRSNVEGLAARMQDTLLAAGYPPAEIALAPGDTANGEAHDILVRGGRFLSLIGSNPRFHDPDDRWPQGVDLPRATALCGAVAHIVTELAR